LLVGRLLEAVVGRAAVVGHGARPVPADDPRQHLGTALGVDGEAGAAVVTDPSVEPDGVPADPPAGLIRRQVPGRAELVPNLLVGGLEPPAAAQHDLGAGAAR